MITENDIEKAREICKKIAHSVEFKDWMFGHKFTYTDVHNTIIYSWVYTCAFASNIFFYHQPKRFLRSLVVGYTDSKGIHVNTAAVKTLPELVGNLAHESMHVLGYRHPFFDTKQRPFSVPYAIGYFFKQEAVKYV